VDGMSVSRVRILTGVSLAVPLVTREGVVTIVRRNLGSPVGKDRHGTLLAIFSL
jgi:hypothetical protein